MKCIRLLWIVINEYVRITLRIGGSFVQTNDLLRFAYKTTRENRFLAEYNARIPFVYVYCFLFKRVFLHTHTHTVHGTTDFYILHTRIYNCSCPTENIRILQARTVEITRIFSFFFDSSNIIPQTHCINNAATTPFGITYLHYMNT